MTTGKLTEIHLRRRIGDVGSQIKNEIRATIHRRGFFIAAHGDDRTEQANKQEDRASGKDHERHQRTEHRGEEIFHAVTNLTAARNAASRNVACANLNISKPIPWVGDS